MKKYTSLYKLHINNGNFFDKISAVSYNFNKYIHGKDSSVVVSYVNNEMVITEKEDGFIAATNFYLHDDPFDYEKQGSDRYEILGILLKTKLTPLEKRSQYVA